MRLGLRNELFCPELPSPLELEIQIVGSLNSFVDVSPSARDCLRFEWMKGTRFEKNFREQIIIKEKNG